MDTQGCILSIILLNLMLNSNLISCKVSITVSNDSMTLNWNKSEELITSYYSQIDLGGEVSKSNATICFRKLVPGTSYNLKLNVSLNNGTAVLMPKEIITKPNHPINVYCEQNYTNALFHWWTPNECADYFLVRIEKFNSDGLFQVIQEELLDWTELNTEFRNLSRNDVYYSTVWNICNVTGKIVKSDPVKIKCQNFIQDNQNNDPYNEDRDVENNVTSTGKVDISPTQLSGSDSENEQFENSEANDTELYLMIIIGSILIIVFVTFYTLFKSNKIKPYLIDNLKANFANQDDSKRLLNKKDDLEIKRDDLEICHQVGSGFFGSVHYGILNLHSGRVKHEVAVKKSNFIGSENDKALFLKEAHLMKNFNHENVMTLIGVSFESNGSPLVILPFMKKGDLLSYLRNNENEPGLGILIRFAIDVAKGMEYLSAKHFVHRDLAARNCMIDKNRDTQMLSIKVADFGLTRSIIEKNYYRTVNMEQLMPIRWMSIESLQKDFYDTKTDVWSYGVLVWEIFTRGVIPYSNLNNKQIISYLISGKRLQRPEYCPEQIYNMLVDCWITDPKLRPTFTNMKEFLVQYIEHINQNELFHETN